MSSFELSPEHEDFRKSVREFAEAEIAPHAAEWDKKHHFPTDVVQKMGGLGLMGLTAPRSTAVRTGTSPASAWRSRRSAASTSRWGSRSRPRSVWGSTRS